jgi:hypothetical protein
VHQLDASRVITYFAEQRSTIVLDPGIWTQAPPALRRIALPRSLDPRQTEIAVSPARGQSRSPAVRQAKKIRRKRLSSALS